MWQTGEEVVAIGELLARSRFAKQHDSFTKNNLLHITSRIQKQDLDAGEGCRGMTGALIFHTQQMQAVEIEIYVEMDVGVKQSILLCSQTDLQHLQQRLSAM